MNKKFVLVLAAMLTLSVTSCLAEQLEPLDFSKNSKDQKETKQTASGFGSSLDTKTKFYQNPSLKNSISKFRRGDYSGCLQELFSYVQVKPNDAVAYYYMAMAFTKIGDSDAAIKSYERVIAISKDPTLSEYATKGKNCLVYGPTCQPDESEAAKNAPKEEPKAEPTKEEQLENFITSPYGNGLSPELEKQIKEEKLKNIQDTINRKDKLDNKDLEKIKKFDIENSSSKLNLPDRLAKAEPSDKDILKAIKTLRDAGMDVSVQAVPSKVTPVSGQVTGATSSAAITDLSAENSTQQTAGQQPINPAAAMMGGYTDPQMAQISMMLGNNNNNNNNMMNMLPFLMQQQQNGQNIDPQVMQAIMMQQMMPSMDFGLSNNNNN